MSLHSASYLMFQVYAPDNSVTQVHFLAFLTWQERNRKKKKKKTEKTEGNITSGKVSKMPLRLVIYLKGNRYIQNDV